MALSILDGTQTATTLSTILSSGQHITAHTVVSLGTQAITDIVNATSAGLTNTQLRASAVTIGGTVTANAGNNFPETIANGLLEFTLNEGFMPISGTINIGAGTAQIGSVTASISNSLAISSLPAISGTVTANLENVAGTHTGDIPSRAVRIGWGAEDTFIGAGTDAQGQPLPIQIYLGNSNGDIVTSDDNVTTANPLPISGTVTIGSLPAISGTVTANTFALQGTAVTTSNFTSTTASTVLANFNATREVLTIFNEGAGNLHICAGATCTTIAYQVRLSVGDYYEVPNHQTTITHSAVFATAGTARVTEVS